MMSSPRLSLDYIKDHSSRADKNSMFTTADEILISSHHLTASNQGDIYEFILNDTLEMLECVHLAPNNRRVIQTIQHAVDNLQGFLFELQHVRVNPNLDNSYIIQQIKNKLNQIGVSVSNPPSQQSMAICYKPLGEISNNVRFYLNREGKLIFLSPATKPRLIYTRPKA
jgi:hypothetical protein